MTSGSVNEEESDRNLETLATALPKLTAEQLAIVSPQFVRESYEAGQTVIQQGEPADRFYILLSGQVEIWHEDLEGNAHFVTQSGPGDYFGETGLMHNHPRTATVVVSSDGGVELLALDRQHFQQLMDESKATEVQVAREMIQRLIDLSDFQE